MAERTTPGAESRYQPPSSSQDPTSEDSSVSGPEEIKKPPPKPPVALSKKQLRKARKKGSNAGQPASTNGPNVNEAARRPPPGAPRKATNTQEPRTNTPITRRQTVSVEPEARLRPISEGQESDRESTQSSSSNASQEEPEEPVKRSHAQREDPNIAQRRALNRHPAAQRANTFPSLTSPSTASLVSGITNVSGLSAGSNSTVTQRSYDAKANLARQKKAQEQRRRLETEPSPTQSEASMGNIAERANVFAFMEGTSPINSPGTPDGARPPTNGVSVGQNAPTTDQSESTTSSEYSESDSETPNTGPAPGAAPVPPSYPFPQGYPAPDYWAHRERFSQDSGISVRGGSPEKDQYYRDHPQQPGAPSQTSSDGGTSEGDDSGHRENEAQEDRRPEQPPVDEKKQTSHSMALQRHRRRRLPSMSRSSSRQHGDDDPHIQRMRDQEQNVREHVLRSPRPQHDYRAYGSPPQDPARPVPFYEPQAQYPIPPGQFFSPPPTHPAPSQDATGLTTAPPMLPPGAPNHMVAPYQGYQPYPPGQQPYGGFHNARGFDRPVVTGYELLASKLSEHQRAKPGSKGRVVPMYRKFENLNHRILLHLQDEICELEEELRFVDQCAAQAAEGGMDGFSPASRRAEARYGGEIHHRRTELLGKIFVKLGQYNQALSSYGNTMKTLEPARTDDLRAYRAWMEKFSPIEKSEARFLEQESDLMSAISPKSDIKPELQAQGKDAQAAGKESGPLGPTPTVTLGMLSALVLPLVAFSVIPGFTGRLFVVFLIGGAEAVVVSSTTLIHLMSVRDWSIAAAVYVAFVSAMAGVSS